MGMMHGPIESRWACRMELAKTLEQPVDSLGQRPLCFWRCATGCGPEVTSRNEHVLYGGGHYCYAQLPEPQLIYLHHTKGQPDCVSDWHLFKIEYCTWTPGMLGRSRERQIITLSDQWRYESSHSTAALPGAGYPSPY